MEPHGVFKEVTKQCTNKDHHQSGPGAEASSRHRPVKISDALEILDVNLRDSVDETKVEITECLRISVTVVHPCR